MHRIYWIPDTLEQLDALYSDIHVLYPHEELGNKEECLKTIKALRTPVVFYASSVDSLLLQFPSLTPWKEEFYNPTHPIK